MAGHRQVIVIGGGVVGCSVLYHLAKKGWTDLTLIERAELTSGSSWHAAGSFHTFNSNTNVARLQAYTINLYKELEEISGQAISVHITGGFIMACTEERLDYLKVALGKGRYLDMDLELVTPSEAAEKMPLLDPSQFVGALYDPREGHLDPSGATMAYAKAAKMNGAEVIEHSRVLEINRMQDGKWEVVTEKGAYQAEHVVNAAGLWARELGQMVGLQLPVLAMEHQYLLTDDVPEVVDYNKRTGQLVHHLIDPDGEIYVRQERNGILLGTYEQACVPWSKESTPWDFTHELLQNDMERIAPSLEVGFAHLPALSRTGIRKVINGPFTFTPDGNPLVGQVKGMENYWCACGVMAGFSQGGGVGLALANWMVDGDPGFDIWGMDVSRFGDWLTPEYTMDTVRQFYQRRFSVTYPNEELPAGRNMRHVPIHGELEKLGANFGVAYGVETPNWFASSGAKPVETPTFKRSEAFGHVGAEVRAVRENVGLMEISTFAKYRVTGKNAAEWLSWIMANRMPEEGRLRLTTMLDGYARVIGDFTVANMGKEGFYIFGSGVAENYHMRWFTSNMDRRDVQIRPQGLDLAGLALSGPNSRRLLASLCDDSSVVENMKFFDIVRATVGGVNALVGRISFTGELGYEMWMDAGDESRLFAEIMKAGDEDGLRLCGSRALQSLRIEKGFGSWATEYRSIYTPAEAGISWLVNMEKGDFMGRKAYEKISRQRKQQRLVSISIEGNEVDAVSDEPLLHKGKAVGWVTSGAYGHYLERSLALGYVRHDISDGTSDLEVEILGERYPVLVSGSALYDPEGKRMRS